MSELTLWADDQQKPARPQSPHVPSSHHGTRQGYGLGCRCNPCTAAWSAYNSALRRGQRICQHCGNNYPRTSAGGGTKFCADCQANGVYNRHTRPPRVQDATCQRCSNPYRRDTNRRYPMCHDCLKHPVFWALKATLGKHKAPLATVLAVMDWPYCANENCGAWLLERAHRKSGTTTKWVYNAVVDHDHSCCPTETSCGECIRGVICRDCNMAMPHRIDAYKAQGLANYLQAHEHGN